MRRIVALVVALAVLAACGAAGSPSPSTPSSGASPLAGTTWALQSIGDTRLPAGVVVTLDLSVDQASGSSGSNQYSGAYSTVGSTITFGPLAVTEMACPDAPMAVESTYLAALAQVTTWAVPADASMGTELTLIGPEPASKLVFGPAA
jgi:heat shock protein HslJ